MTDDKKLPLVLQLVGITAVLVFCFSAISAFNYGRALWLNREVISSLANHTELLVPFTLRVAVCTVSALAFFLLLVRSVRGAAFSSILYLSFLLFLLGWQLFSSLAQPQGLELQGFFSLGLAIKLCYAGWLVGLLFKVWPNYSVKRNAAERLG